MDPQTSPNKAASSEALTIYLVSPRGFCAGVERAIEIVEQALERYGPPIYVRHEIVHNRTVVEDLERKGVVFVDELDAIPPSSRPQQVIFSAHGVPKSVIREARRRGLEFIDATCPLVSKVHREAERSYLAGDQIVLIGHAGHPEVEGTIGQLPHRAVLLIEHADQVPDLQVDDPERLAYVTQTTLAMDETDATIAALKRRFPRIRPPHHEDICYATTNRQDGVAAVASQCDLVVVIGSPNSSNSNRLVEVARRAGAGGAMLLDRVAELEWTRLAGVRKLGLTAGASAPETLVQEFIAACRERFEVHIEQVRVTTETLRFKLPKPLVA